MRPVTIAGAGLAGLTLANTLQQAGVPTTLHEAHTLPRHRVCGEFICGRGAAALEQMGLADSLHGARKHHSIQWFRKAKAVLRSELPEPAYGISRHLLDQRLAERFRRAGGSFIENSRRATATPQEGRVLCHGREASPSDWIGLKFHARNLTTTADLELHLAQHGYLGLSAIENGRVNVCALFKRRPDLKAPKNELLLTYLQACGLHSLKDRLQAATIDPESHMGVAGIQFATAPRNEAGVLRLGDAYSVIPPFTGNGMSVALESAAIASPVLIRFAQGQSDWHSTVDRIHQQLQQRFHRRLRCAKALHPWIHHPRRQQILSTIARLQLIPFQTLYRLTH